MEPDFFNQKFTKVFNRFGNGSAAGLSGVEVDFYEKLLHFSMIGDSYYFILNHHNLDFEFVSKEIEEVMGYRPAEFSLGFINDILHPEDRRFFLNIETSLTNFFSSLPLNKLDKYKVRYDVRYRKKNGDYARILYQGVTLEYDNNGTFLRSLGVHTDITYLKQDGKPLLSLIGIDGEPSYIDVGSKNTFIESNEALTGREKQILCLLIEGKLSKEISSILNISKQTVDTHRKNMIHKNHLNNTGELIGKAIKHGWI